MSRIWEPLELTALDTWLSNWQPVVPVASSKEFVYVWGLKSNVLLTRGVKGIRHQKRGVEAVEPLDRVSSDLKKEYLP